MKEVLLGIDIGTSACKVAAFLPSGALIAQESEEYPVQYPQNGWAQQEPEKWWKAVCKVLQRLFDGKLDAGQVLGIGVDGQSWSAVAVDRDGKVLCPTPIWMDTRASVQCEAMKENCGEERLFSICKNPVQPMYTMSKVLWYQEELPLVYAQTDKILQSNGFIVYRLTGEISQDHSQGYGWNCYDVEKKRWAAEICREAGIRESLLPPLAESYEVIGRVSERAAKETGLLSGTPVVAGGLDAACAALGVGVIYPGQTQEQGGQAGGMSICTEEAHADIRLILSPHVVPGRWLLQGGTVGGGGAVRWFSQEFGETDRAEARRKGTHTLLEMDTAAAAVEPGCGGLVFLPYLAGERSPLWNPKATGVFYGIDFSKSRSHFARSVMEGVAFSLRHNLETAEKAGAGAKTLRSMGGAANSPLWTQIKADVTGKSIEVPVSDTASALGAAILAGVGTGLYPSFEHAVAQTVKVKRMYHPDEGKKAVYDKAYQTYRELYKRLEVMMKG